MPVAIWNDRPYDRYAIYSGSATIVGGVPHIIYPGLCLHDEWPVRTPHCVNLATAVPSDPRHDVLLENWTKPAGPGINPIVNGSSKDPSPGWHAVNGTEWRFSDNTGRVFISKDFERWSPAHGSAGFPVGDCPSLQPLPLRRGGGKSDGGRAGGARSPRSTERPTHVHVNSGNPFGSWAQVGVYEDGPAGTAGVWRALNMTASRCLARTRGGVGACGRAIDRGQIYAATQFVDPVKDRLLLWSWALADTNSTMALLREVVWNPELQQLEFPPVEEQAELRGRVLENKTGIAVPANGEVPLGPWADGAGNQSEMLINFTLPAAAAATRPAVFGLVVMGDGPGTMDRKGAYFWLRYTPATTNATGDVITPRSVVVGARNGGHQKKSAGGIPLARVMPGVNLRGDDLEVLRVNYTDYRTCQQTCDANAKCAAWTFCDGCPFTKCCLKVRVPVPTKNTNRSIYMVSGVSRPPPPSGDTQFDPLHNGCPLESNMSACNPVDTLQLGSHETTVSLRVRRLRTPA